MSCLVLARIARPLMITYSCILDLALASSELLETFGFVARGTLKLDNSSARARQTLRGLRHSTLPCDLRTDIVELLITEADLGPVLVAHVALQLCWKRNAT
jgi:hypothetical protein